MFADPISAGAMIPVVLGGVALAIRGVWWLVEKQQEAEAVTPAQKREIVLRRLQRNYEKQRNPDPIGAACDHLHMLEGIERYRRWACEEYLRTGKTQRTLEDEWLASNKRTFFRGLDDPAAVMRYNAALADTIRKMAAEDVFTYEPALSKWKEADAAFWRDHAAHMRNQKRNEVADFVAEAAFAAGNRI